MRSLHSATVAGLATVVAVHVLSPVLDAQVQDVLPIATQHVATELDSGYLANPTSAPRVVFEQDVSAAGAAWFRLLFGTTNLPAGSRLELRATRDGAVQRFDGASLRDYDYGSAWFNGDRVRVTLVAGPETTGNRVVVDRLEFAAAGVPGPDSICGSTDDRQLSNDPRVGRAVTGPGACSWWLISEFAIVTAGHCSSGSGPWIVGFNIPLSRPDGTYVQPHPDDQYPLDVGSLRRQDSGIGADWAVLAAGRNSNHGQYPGQRQGDWFALGAVPGSVGGVDIRITGNGRVSAPVPPTWNAVQKTHVGPRASTSRSNALAYRADTTGGNSGSPIIHEQTGEAIGVHTHGGCNASGGRNYGTRIDRSNLASAIAQVRSSKIVGAWTTFGQGCAGSAGVPALDVGGVPDVGGTVRVVTENLPSNGIGALLVGISDTTWIGGGGGVGLPFGLGGFGLTGCDLFVSVEGSVSRTASASGRATYDLALPGAAALISTSAYFQYLSLDPAAGNPAGAAVSDAAHLFIGG